MKVLNTATYKEFKELTVEESWFFGLLKVPVVYRKYNDGTILWYRAPDRYHTLSIAEHIRIKQLFSIIP